MRNDGSGRNPFANFSNNILIMSVQTHITITMINDNQQSQVSKPVCKNDLSTTDCLYIYTDFSIYDNTLPF